MIPQTEHYILNQEKEKQELLFTAHHVILSCSDYITEKFRYQSPFFDYKGIMMYLYVSAKKEVIVGFVNGVEMQDELNLLSAGDRKQIRHYVISRFNDKVADNLRLLVFEAMRVQEEKKERVKRRSAKF